jgi:predicted nuclease with TOPRIM domain
METLKSEKAELQGKFETLKTDHERVVKENQILRKAVTIQQERFNTAENEVKSVKAHASDRIKSLESIISQLRYHLQAHQNIGNDFMNQLPPDVY